MQKTLARFFASRIVAGLVLWKVNRLRFASITKKFEKLACVEISSRVLLYYVLCEINDFGKCKKSASPTKRL